MATPSPMRAVMRTGPDATLARASAAAVRGVVTRIVAVRDPAVDAVYTTVTVAVSRSWGFPDRPAQVDIKLLGGVTGGAALIVGGQAQFAVGEEVLALLEVRPRDGTLSVTGLAQGKWTVTADRTARAPGVHEMADERPRPAVVDVEGLASLAGTSVRLPIGWRPTPPLGREPATAALATADVTPVAGRWHEGDWGAAVAVDSDAGGHALFPAGGFAQLLRAIDTWSGASALRLVPGTLRGPRCFSSVGPADGRVSITYGDPCDEIADTSPTLALGGVFFDPGDVRVVQGVAYGRITRGVVVLDNVAAKFANFSTGCYEEVLTHEIGHAIGLPHAPVQPAVMYPWLAPECVEREVSRPLQPADVAAAVARYPSAEPGDGPPGVPGGLTAQVQGATVSLSWLPATGAAATTFQLHAGSVPGASDLAVVTLATPAYVATAVPRGVYYVRVVASNALGASAPGADIAVVVGDGLPGVPVGLMAAGGPAGAVRVFWQPPVQGPPPDGYTLLVGVSPGHPTTRIPMAGTSLSATGVQSGTYFVRAAGVNSAGMGPASAEIVVVVP